MKKFSSISWIIILCISLFIGLGAIWTYNTYGDFSSAMSNEHFLNFIRYSRRSFLKWVLLPTTGVFVILVVLQIIVKKKKEGFPDRLLFFVSVILMAFVFFGAEVRLDIHTYFVRQYRLGKEQWYDTNRIIVHALGEIDGNSYTNSKEALENSYQNGIRFFECDFSMTSDNRIVACHDWDSWYYWTYSSENTKGYVPDFAEFMKMPIMGQYTALAGEDILTFLKEHPDAYIVTDTKDGNPDTLAQPFNALAALAEEHECKEVLDRFIVQIYHEYMYETVNSIYPFQNYIFTLYQEGFDGDIGQMKKYADFCIHHNIDVITM